MLEFNELCPHLLVEFREQGKLPNFQRLYKESAIYTTDADEAAPHLEPWIQWMSIHSGLSYREHGAFHLGDGRNVTQKCLAELLSNAGIRVGVFASMNTNYQTLNGYYIPDPWDAHAKPSPNWLAPFFDTVSKQVQSSSGEDGLSKGELVRFGWFMLRHGLSKKTIRSAIKQLADERKDPGVKWRRASLLEKIQYDLFRYLDQKFRPQFATFFCNSTAHYQHYYWRNMHPEIFEMPPDQNDHSSLQTAIQYGYEQMDQLIGNFLRDFPHATLILCTALSQQPWTNTTKCTFRPRKFEDLLAFAEINPALVRVEPVMAEEFRLGFSSESAMQEARERLEKLSYGDLPLMKLEAKDRSIFTGCNIQDARAMQGTVKGVDGKARAFRDLFHMVHSVRSGRHHPDGVLWIRDGKHRVVESKVALTSIAPTVLGHFEIAVPKSMRGESLIPRQTPSGSEARSLSKV